MIPSDPSSKGSLEELFRHHLLESETASIPPRPLVWDQLENSLLLQENERYRRRLRAYRWAMAASLLLTALVGGGWWRSQLGRAAPELAATSAPAGIDLGRPGGVASSSALTNNSFFTATASSIEQTATLTTPGATISPATSYGLAIERGLLRPALSGTSHWQTAWLSTDHAPVLAFARTRGQEAVTDGTVYAADQPLDAEPASTTEAGGVASAVPAGRADLLGARSAGLSLPALAALPSQLQQTSVMPGLTGRPTSPWQVQVAYAASVFNPNIDFTRSPGDYNANLGPGTVATTRDAAAEYRQHLRPGLGQRLSVWATRRLGIGRWSLRSGVEVARYTANSSSSVAFTGEQVATLSNYVQVQPNRLQTTTFNYQTVSVPLEVTYTRPLHRGLSLYGRVGTLFSALVSARSEVAGTPETIRTYRYQDPASPYRSLTSSLRGGVSLRYQPNTRPWALSLGPVAEASVLSLNIDPTQDFWNQRRAYSFGLEAGVEFGSWLKPTPTSLLH